MIWGDFIVYLEIITGKVRTFHRSKMYVINRISRLEKELNPPSPGCRSKTLSPRLTGDPNLTFDRQPVPHSSDRTAILTEDFKCLTQCAYWQPSENLRSTRPWYNESTGCTSSSQFYTYLNSERLADPSLGHCRPGGLNRRQHSATHAIQHPGTRTKQTIYNGHIHAVCMTTVLPAAVFRYRFKFWTMNQTGTPATETRHSARRTPNWTDYLHRGKILLSPCVIPTSVFMLSFR